jgi:hypothetical protein
MVRPFPTPAPSPGTKKEAIGHYPTGHKCKQAISNESETSIIFIK